MSQRQREARAERSRSESSASIFAALGDPRRLRIVARLSSEGPLSITGLASGSDVTRQAITKHLAVLADAGLVRGARTGRERLFELEPRPLGVAVRHLAAMSARWDAAIGRLRRDVER
jgi:DNA-binding transcriptional ArsR family regulator